MTYNEYYDFYLSRHQNKWCRRLHFLGQTITCGAVAMTAWLIFAYSWTHAPLLLLAPFVVYPFAVFGHLFEGQLPAFFGGNVLKAKVSDMRMCFNMLRGRIPF